MVAAPVSVAHGTIADQVSVDPGIIVDQVSVAPGITGVQASAHGVDAADATRLVIEARMTGLIQVKGRCREIGMTH